MKSATNAIISVPVSAPHPAPVRLESTESVPSEATQSGVYLSSVLAVTALFFFGVGLPCWYAFDLAWGVGLGGMCAVWGGPGFGVMAASARLAARAERSHTGETSR